MNGPDRSTFGLILILAGVGLNLLGITFTRKTEAALVAATPEEAVQQVLDSAYKGRHEEAVLRFEGGRQLWTHSPSWVEQYLDRVTDRGNAVAFQVQAEGQKGDARLLLITTYSDQERTNPLRSSAWHFIRKGGGWVIRKVE